RHEILPVETPLAKLNWVDFQSPSRDNLGLSRDSSPANRPQTCFCASAMMRYNEAHAPAHMKYRCSRGICLSLLVFISLTLPFLAYPQTNGVLREFYSGVGNGSIQAFTNSPSFPASPTSESIETAFFEAPSNIAENYGQRMRALLSPPVSGNYVFYIATDDQGALFLSTDENPDNRVKIASVPT